MATGGMAGNVDAGRISAVVAEMFGKPGDLSLLKTLNAGEIPGCLWLSEF
jgi:hypothetical protein